MPGLALFLLGIENELECFEVLGGNGQFHSSSYNRLDLLRPTANVVGMSE